MRRIESFCRISAVPVMRASIDWMTRSVDCLRRMVSASRSAPITSQEMPRRKAATRKSAAQEAQSARCVMAGSLSEALRFLKASVISGSGRGVDMMDALEEKAQNGDVRIVEASGGKSLF